MITRYLDINVCVWCGLSAATQCISANQKDQGSMALAGVKTKFLSSYPTERGRGRGTDKLTITATMTTTTISNKSDTPLPFL